MRIRSVLVAGILLAGPVVAAPAASAAPAGPSAPAEFFDAARPELGPAALPTTPPVRSLLFFYQRFGGLTPDRFAAKYRAGGSWVYPPADGFLVIGGKQVRYRQKLAAGTRIDRFGYSGGSYLSPARTLFAQRALPPQNLTTPVGTPQSNYHLYCVLAAFDVDAGLIAPWFEQPGLGLQFKLDPGYVPGAGTAISVNWLIQNGYLVEERPA